MSSLRTKQQLDARLATQAEAEAGTDNTKLMTPLMAEQHMTANSLGWGQTWQSVSGSRVIGTSYQNTTGRPIVIAPRASTAGASNLVIEVSLNNSTWVVVASNAHNVGSSWTDATVCGTVVVPNGVYYRFRLVSGSGTLTGWTELR
jgi:hypothetical protein